MAKIFSQNSLQQIIGGAVIFSAVFGGIVAGHYVNNDQSYQSKTPLVLADTNIPQFSSPNIPTTLQNLLNKSPNNNLIERFEVNESGELAKGWLVDLQGAHQLYWSFGQYVVAGALVGADGVNLTEKYIEDKSPGLSNNLWAQLTNSMFIQASSALSSNKENALYVFYEPFCGACSSLMNRLIPLMKKNELDVRLIPVAWLKPESPNAIQAMLDGKDHAFAEHERLKQSRQQVPTADVTPETKAGIIRNGDLMSSMNIQGTPAVVYKGNNGKIINLGVASESELSVAIREIKSRGK